MKKVILITGASSGLGQAIANYLHQQGHTVYGTSRKSIQANWNSLVMDVCNEQSVTTGVQQIISNEQRIDVLINNAGLGIAGALEETLLTDVSLVFNTNVQGVVATSKAVLPYMRKQQSGHIINISSVASEMGLPYRAIYSASKAAVDKITEALRMEVSKYNIQVCSVQPADINTPIGDHRVMAPAVLGSVYQESFQRTMNHINEGVKNGVAPESIAPLIEKIIFSKKVKRAYLSGKPMQTISVHLKKWLPNTWFEGIIKKYYEV